MARRQRSSRDEVVREEVDSGVADLVADPDRPHAWTLLLDGVPQSHVDLDDPQRLEFEYVRRLGHVVDLTAPPGAPLRVLHLGGGAFTLPRYISATRPRSGQQVVEVDAALVGLVRRSLPLDRAWRIRVRTGDAREVLAKAPQDAFDLLVVDAYAGGRTPAHLTTSEFVALAARTLRAGGVYAANLADGPPLAFARAQVATIRTALPYAALMAEPAVLRGRRFGNLVVVAGRDGPPVDLAALTRLAACDPFPARVVYGDELSRFVAGAVPATDASARPSPAPPPALFH